MHFPSSDPACRHAVNICSTLQAQGHQALLAGGCVRDSLLGRTPVDYDVATSATPDEVEALFDRTLDVGRSFGVIRVLSDGQDTEVATFREDSPTGDGRRPDRVTYSTAERDAERRDFTVNALFYNPETDELLDFVDGEADLRNQLIRCVGVPRQRFQEDHLRMLRAVRFASVLDFQLHPATLAGIREQAAFIRQISPERIENELTRTLVEAPQAGEALDAFHQAGLLEPILPEITRLIGQAQPPQYHPEGDVYVHTRMMLDAMDRPTPTLAWAVLLHDVGKPATAETTIEPDGSERIRFNNHDRVGAEMAQAILTRLKMSRRRIDAVVDCVRNHMRFAHVQQMRQAKLRRLMGAKTFPIELELHRLDCLCSHGDISNVTFLQEKLVQWQSEPVLPPRWITGRDLLAAGVPEGPTVGHWIQRCYDQQLDGTAPDRDALLRWLATQDLTQVDPPSTPPRDPG